MARKYISRKDIDDSEFLSGIENKLDVVDASDAQDRSIHFTATQRPQTPSEIAAEKAQELTSASEDASQYIEQVNSHFNKQISTIDKLKRQKEEFEKEMRLLQGEEETVAPPTPMQRQEKMAEMRTLAQKKRVEEQKLADLDSQISQAKAQIQRFRQSPPVENASADVPISTLSDSQKQALARFLSNTMGKKIDSSALSKTLDELSSNTE
ncbi:hypothetical protein [Candidatus Nitrosotenuis cloacae]|uniref:hypothetical protein n=1 Tax=Candidatus Nitrosotenuis cloacae TaxID=1603555 RepID=UPI00227ECA8B|nr:hypothetical protein [Candidatus Nitrosotenuis cloacae]